MAVAGEGRPRRLYRLLASATLICKQTKKGAGRAWGCAAADAGELPWRGTIEAARPCCPTLLRVSRTRPVRGLRRPGGMPFRRSFRQAAAIPVAAAPATTATAAMAAHT